LLFAEDMPIIDVTGNSSNSWMIYKLLLASPSIDAGTESTPDAAAEDAAVDDAGGADADVDATLAGDAGAPEMSDAGPTDGGAPDGGTTDGGTTDGGAPDGGAPGMVATPVVPPVVPPVDVSGVHALAFTAISDVERATLSNYILGRPMPYPPQANVKLNDQNDPLTLDEMERISLWIAQGAAAPATCP
jgi:hypothetical protein